MNLSWQDFKSFVLSKMDINKSGLSVQWIEAFNRYLIKATDGFFSVETNILKSDNPDQEDFETNYKDKWKLFFKQEVVTQTEKSDKILKTLCAFAETDSNGSAEVCIPVPSGGRWVAYGDAEFETRHMGDYISTLEITDLDRQIAWSIALTQDPNATAPVADSIVQASGYPIYPVVGHYDERVLPSPMPSNAKGTIKSGMSMTFQYGTTEAQPVGGYGFIPGGFYFRIVAQKATGHTAAGQKFQVSVDWAQNE